MRYAIALVLLALLIAALPAGADAQRKRSNPFSDFHKQAALAVGKSAPALHLKDVEDNEGDLRDYLGSWVFIEFGSYT